MEKSNSSNGIETNNTQAGIKAKNKSKFISDFCDHNIMSGNNKNSKLDDVYNMSDISGNLKESLQKELDFGASESTILDSKGNKVNKYEGVILTDIKILDIHKNLGPKYLELNQKRRTLEESILSEYIFTDNDKNNLGAEIKNLNDIELFDSINRNKKKVDFLSNLFGNNLEKKDFESFSSLSSLSEEEYNKKLNKITGIKKQQIKTAFLELKNGMYSSVNFQVLIESDFLTSEQKRDIVKTFIPFITLEEALEYKFITETELKEKKKDILGELNCSIDGISDEDFNNFIKKTKASEIVISTDFLTDDNIMILSEEKGFKCIEKDFKELKEDIRNKEEAEGPNGFEEFKKELSSLPNVSGVENLTKKSILNIKIAPQGYETKEEFLKVSNTNNSNCLDLGLLGDKRGKERACINTKMTSESTERYVDIINRLKDPALKMQLHIFTEEEFEKETSNEELYKVTISGLDKFSKIELKEDSILAEKVKNKVLDKNISELYDLEKELSLKISEKKLLREDSTLNKKNKESKLNTLTKQIQDLEKQIEIKKNLIEEVDGINSGDLSEQDLHLLVSNNSISDLIDKIDSLDSEGKILGLEKGVIIETEKGVYEVLAIDLEAETIVLNIPRTNETQDVPYEDFYNTFKETKGKRVEKINTTDEFLRKNSWDNDYKLTNGKLIQKEVNFNGKKEDKGIDFFIDDKGNVLKIISINNGEVEFGTGKSNEGKEDDETKITKNSIKLDKGNYNYSLNEFQKLISDDKYLPNWKIGKSYSIENISKTKNEINESMSTSFWNRTSVSELLAGGKMLFDGIEEYFKKGNDIKAAEFALKWAKYLPEEAKQDFIAQTEMKEQEAMDKELTALTKIGSGVASARVLGRLQNKSTRKEKIEAGLMFVSKYGLLYPKKLADKNGSFLWYEALGGKIGDARYEREKASAIKAGLPFDEKELLIGLLGEQSGGHGVIKRRSKFFKEFKGKIAAGYSEEYGDGYNDATDKRNVADIVKGGYDEIEGGTIPNGLGWAKRAVEKGGTLKEMNELYFTLLYSGALYNAPGKVLEELKNHWSVEGNGMILAAFGASTGGQRIFNTTVKSLSHRLEAADPEKCSGMGKMADDLFSDALNVGDGKYKSKVQRSREFWNKYGDVLSRTLFMADGDSKDLEYAKTDKVLAFEADGEYSEYYEYMKGWTAQGSAFKKDFMEDEVGPSGITGMDTHEIIKKFYVMSPSRTFKSDNQKVIDLTWSKIWGDLKATSDKVKEDPTNKEKYKKFLNKKLREVAAGLLTGAGKDFVSTLDVVEPTGLDLASIGIKLSDFSESRIDDVLKGTNGVGKSIFDNAIDNIIEGNFSGKARIGKSSIFDTTETFKNKTSEAINDSEEQEPMAA